MEGEQELAVLFALQDKVGHTCIACEFSAHTDSAVAMALINARTKLPLSHTHANINYLARMFDSYTHIPFQNKNAHTFECCAHTFEC